MKLLAASILLLAAPAVCLFSQQIDPGNKNDAATFGNHHNSKPEKNPTSRTVTGQVTDKNGRVLEGAMVTLTDKKTNDKTDFFTKKDGRYQFADLSFTKDYEVQARYKDKASELKKLSQFDRLPKPVRILEVPIYAPAKPAVAANSAKP